MGRSVSKFYESLGVMYFNLNSCLDDSEDLDNQIDDMNFYFDELEGDIVTLLRSKYPTLLLEKDRWDGREIRILLSNSFCEIGISSYCDIVSLSIRVHQNVEWYQEGLAINWINSVWPKMMEHLQKNIGVQSLTRVGGMSNGESVYQLA